MSEYIISYEQLEQIYFDAFMDGANDEPCNEIDKSSFDELIRCRDCSETYRSDGGYYLLPNGEILLDGTAFCECLMMIVDLDGYCSNAERKSQ